MTEFREKIIHLRKIKRKIHNFIMTLQAELL